MIHKIRIKFAFALVLALSIAGATALSQQTNKTGTPTKDDEIKLSSELILMNITVTSTSGDFIRNLTKEHFNITEEGKPQKVEFFGAEKTPFAAAILLDVSGGMEDKIRLAKVGMAQFADHLGADDVLAVYQFGNEIKKLQDFTSDRDISDYMWDAEAKGETRIYDCLVEAVEAMSKRDERRRAILIVSDGMDNRSSHTLDDSLRRALAANVVIYSIDLIGSAGGGRVATEELQGHAVLKQMAEKTGGRYLPSPGGSHLTEALTKVVEELNNEYTVGYYSTNEKRDGKWRRVEVQLPKPNVSIHTRAGYYAPKDK